MGTNNEEKLVELRKIPLYGFIDLLQELYDKGADYIDIIGKPDDVQDIMSIVVKEEYVDRFNNGFTEEDDISIEGPISETSLNDLI